MRKKAKLINRDATGNTLICDVFENGNAQISLRLLSENRDRLIGVINKEESVLMIQRIPEKHLHIKSNSYGVNEFILRNQPVSFERIWLYNKDVTHSIPVSVVLEKGKHLFFKQTGFEKQVFIPLELLKMYEI